MLDYYSKCFFQIIIMPIETINVQKWEKKCQKKVDIDLKHDLTKLAGMKTNSAGTGHFPCKFNKIQRWRCQNSGQTGGNFTKSNFGGCLRIQNPRPC